MKELSIEEKAQRYDEAIERAKELKNNPFAGYDGTDLLSSLFPELKESEEERIRKWLIGVIKSNEYGSISNVGEMPCPKPDVIAWLEKQGEQKLVEFDDINAKKMFIKALERVEEQNNKGYKLTDCDKNSWWEDFKTYCGHIEMQNPAWSEEDINMFGSILSTLGICANNPQIPADVRSIHKKEELWFNELYHKVQPKHEWSEEDIMRIDNLIAIIEGKGYPDYVKWLESFKDRVQPQPQHEWSEEDERLFISALWHVKNSCGNGGKNSGEFEVYNWLKSLKERYTWKPSEEQIKVLQELCKYSEVANFTEKGVEILKSMYNDIKKLREE